MMLSFEKDVLKNFNIFTFLKKHIILIIKNKLKFLLLYSKFKYSFLKNNKNTKNT